jgi:hypothetical protein
MAAPDGYQVGTAWIQVLPSFRDFHKRTAAEMAGIGDVRVKVEPQVATRKAKAAVAELDAELSRKPIVRRVELDERVFNAKMAALIARRDEMLVKVDADISRAVAKIAELKRKRNNTKIDVDAEIAKAEAKIRYLQAKRDEITINFDVDTDDAERKLNHVEQQLRRMGNIQTDINMEASDASRAISILGLLTAAIGAVGYAAPAAAAAVAAIPVAILAAGQALGTFMAGFRGVGDATKALQAVQDEAAVSAEDTSVKAAKAAGRIADAQSALQRALEGADRAAIQGARQVQDAREGLAQAQVDAARRVVDAERSLETAQVSARDAQEALTRAREAAVERLEDLHLSVAGAALDEEAAVLAVQRARERLDQARARGVTGLDLAEVELGARQAEQSLAEVRERYGDLRDEAAEANQQGVEGNTQVVAAQRQVEESARRVQDAERDLADARTDGARRVTAAQERVAQAQQQAAWAATDASRAIADAQRNLAEATTATGSAGSAAMDKLTLAMGKLGPAGRDFAVFLHEQAKPALDELGDAASETMLPKVRTAFGILLTQMPLVKAAFSDTGNVLGDLAVKGAQMVTSGPWREDFATILDRNNRILGLMGDSGLSALDAMRSLTAASGPLVEGIAASTEASLSQFNAFVQTKRETGELSVWFHEMSARIRELWEVVSQLVGGIWDLAQALAPVGRAILNILGPLAEMIGNFAEANPTITAIIGLAVILGSSFVSFFRTLGGLTQAWRTSKGVFDSLIFGLRDANEKTGQATDALGQHTQAQGKFSRSVSEGTGLVGKLSAGLRTVRDSYVSGATAASSWATATTTAAGSAVTAVQGRLVPALKGPVGEMDKFLPATSRIDQAFGTLATSAQGTFSRISGAVGGTVSAVGRGLGGAVSGVVGALGGPFGLAITAATVGLGFLISAQAEAAEKAAQHKAQIQALTDALVESGGVIDDNVNKQIRLSLEEKSVADNARHLGLNVGQMIQAIARGGDAADNFEQDLFNVSNELIKGKGLPREAASALSDLANQIYITGGEARDFHQQIDFIAAAYQHSKGATDEQTDAFRDQITQFLDLVGGYRNAKGDFKEAEQGQRDVASAQEDAATATERHATALNKLNTEILGQINKDLAYRSAVNGLAEAQTRLAEAQADETSTQEELTAARLAEEQALIQVITAAGELAFANSTAETDLLRQKDATVAMATEAANLANKYGDNLPKSLLVYLESLGVVRTATGEYKVDLDKIPREIPTTAKFDGETAKADAQAYGSWLSTYLGGLMGQPIPGYTPQPGAGGGAPTTLGGLLGLEPVGGGALGAIAIPAYAMGGIRPMSSRFAQIIPPNSPRLIGDRMHGDEGFVPINTEPRSIAILSEIARRMGFLLMPMLAGGLLGMQNGGVNQAGPPAAGTDGAALVLQPVAVEAFTAAVQALIATGLAPLAAEVTGTTAPALGALEDHAGTRSPHAITTLADLLPPLQEAFTATARMVLAAWASITAGSTNSVGAVAGQLAALRQGLQTTGSAFASTSDWIGTTWARIRQYTADPVRAALAGPMNLGLIAAWNYLNGFFALGRPLAPVGIPFAVGGEVPGVGNEDKVPALLTPGEYVISKPVVQKWGLKNIHAAHMATRRGGFPGLEGMLQGDDTGIYRVGYASGGPVPEALARATAFGRSMHGKPYVWGGSSEAGTDCSGWMAMLARALVDEKPYARREWATAVASGGSPPPRFTKGIEGLFAIGVDPGSHTAGTLAGRNVEAGGAHNYVAFGPPSAGADHPQFPLKFHLRELGGRFISGGAGGGSFDLAAFIRDSFNATHQQLAAYQQAWGANMLAQAGAAITSRAADAIMDYATRTIAPMGVSGDVESWRPLVLQALRMTGLPLEWADITLNRIRKESGGNPNAVNLWDVNAQRGDPSKGLLQVIGSTFRAYRDPRAPDNVFDPLANILASFRYSMARYGSLPAAYNRPGGYDDGGKLPPGYSTVYNGLSRPEYVLTDNQWNALISLAATNTSSGGKFEGNLYLSSGEFLGAVEGVIERSNVESGRVLARRIR